MSALATNLLVEFTVAGVPAPQGSKTVGRTKNGRTFVREANKATVPWRNAVAAGALVAMRERPPFAGPLQLDVLFSFPRPRTHYRSGRFAGELKPTAPMYCPTRPDVDKLLRAIGDSLSGTVWIDDGQVAKVRATKTYGTPGALITVKEC